MTGDQRAGLIYIGHAGLDVGGKWCAFDPATRIWWVDPPFFAQISERCAVDMDTGWQIQLALQFGPGPIEMRVTHKSAGSWHVQPESEKAEHK